MWFYNFYAELRDECENDSWWRLTHFFEGAKSNQLLNLLNCARGNFLVAVHNVFHQFHVFFFLFRLVNIHFNNFIHRLMALVISRFLLLIFSPRFIFLSSQAYLTAVLSFLKQKIHLSYKIWWTPSIGNRVFCCCWCMRW